LLNYGGLIIYLTPCVALSLIAVMDETLLAAYAKGLGMEVRALKKLIEERFGKEVE